MWVRIVSAVTERTLVLVKPDAVARGLTGEILARIERKGLRLVALELRHVSAEVAAEHYAEHVERPFYGSLIEFITSGPVVAAVLAGPRAVAAFRQLAGGTDPVAKAETGSIRGDFGLEVQENLVHGSDSVESAKREIDIWFPALG
ncbi:nucleoside-diphosphate kinase [Skermania piniformis]